MIKYLKHLLFVALCCASLSAEKCSYSDLLKGCEAEQARALQEVSSFLRLTERTQFQSLEGGLTRAKLYSFEFEGKKYVLRFLAPNHSTKMRHNEVRALKIGNQLGIAPPCIFSDQNAVLTVMPFVEGQALYQPEDHQLSQLGKMLRALHNYSDSYPTRYSLKDRVELHYQKGPCSPLRSEFRSDEKGRMSWFVTRA